MTNHINVFLATGRRIRTLERQLTDLSVGDPGRRALSAEHERLIRERRTQIAAAHRSGIDWATIEFALVLHSQHADRDVGSAAPTPAEELSALIRQHGAPAVVLAPDAIRRLASGVDA